MIKPCLPKVVHPVPILSDLSRGGFALTSCSRYAYSSTHSSVFFSDSYLLSCQVISKQLYILYFKLTPTLDGEVP